MLASMVVVSPSFIDFAFTPDIVNATTVLLTVTENVLYCMWPALSIAHKSITCNPCSHPVVSTSYGLSNVVFAL